MCGSKFFAELDDKIFETQDALRIVFEQINENEKLIDSLLFVAVKKN